MSGEKRYLHEALLAVEQQARTLLEAGALTRVYYQWALMDPSSHDDSARLADELSREIKEEGRSIHDVAALGFLLAVHPDVVTAYGNSFSQGVTWLVGRHAESASATANLMQPICLLGVMAGLISLGDSVQWSRFGEWYIRLHERCTRLLPVMPSWRLELFSIIQKRTRVPVAEEFRLGADTATSIVFIGRGIAHLEAGMSGDPSGNLLDRILDVAYDEPEQAALDLAAFNLLARGGQVADLRVSSTEHVAMVLSRLPSGLRRWTWESTQRTPKSTVQRWDIQNEYHFQNLLYAVLTPTFPELREEEWLPSVGQKKPRADLVLPILKLVIEVKYWRANTPAQDMISQIGEDASLYLKQGSPYESILPVIWDDGRRSEEHELMKAGLSDIRGVIHPTIIARPALMK